MRGFGAAGGLPGFESVEEGVGGAGMERPAEGGDDGVGEDAVAVFVRVEGEAAAFLAAGAGAGAGGRGRGSGGGGGEGGGCRDEGGGGGGERGVCFPAGGGAELGVRPPLLAGGFGGGVVVRVTVCQVPLLIVPLLLVRRIRAFDSSLAEAIPRGRDCGSPPGGELELELGGRE